MAVTEPSLGVDAEGAMGRFVPTGQWIAVAVVAAIVLGGVTFLVRDVDGVVARATLLAERGGRVSAVDRAIATADGLRASEAVRTPPSGIDDVVVSARPGEPIVELEVTAGLDGAATAHLDLVIEEALAASRDEEIRILETQIAELELTLEALDPDDPTARRAQGDIEVRRGQLAVLTGLVQVVGAPVVDEPDAAPLRDALVVAVSVLVAFGVLVPWVCRPPE